MKLGNTNGVDQTEACFLETRQLEIGFLVAWMTPFLVCLSCFFGATNLVNEPKMIKTLAMLQGLQVCFGYYIFFISICKGYDSIKYCWLKFGPVIHLLMVIYNYFAVPITTLVFYFKSDKSAIVESRILEFSLLVSLGNLIVFSITVVPIIIGAWR